ncbi:hypothetical protein QTN47_04200 [Danxiaibacter flavus]|uniref:DUF4157 domain-containing protein n=1 Tax=Danxiaibacter flavus TaxID=3049108 RepID=A0ABV3ZAX2_9BACT|nr:hypothetical protein QNM32_04200 [Chitinophagaceae bacterium DXS]
MKFVEFLTQFPVMDDAELQSIKGGGTLPPVTVTTYIGGGGSGGSGGGSYDSSQIVSISQGFNDTSQPTYTTSMDYFKAHFQNFKTNHPVVFVDNEAPPGYTMNGDRRFVDARGNVSDAATKLVNGFIFIYVDSYVLNTEMPDFVRQEILGHELVHAKQIEEHYDMYVNNNAQFTLNSEYAAYQYSLNSAKAAGDQVGIQFFQNLLNTDYSGGKAANWTSNYSDVPTR